MNESVSDVLKFRFACYLASQTLSVPAFLRKNFIFGFFQEDDKTLTNLEISKLGNLNFFNLNRTQYRIYLTECYQGVLLLTLKTDCQSSFLHCCNL